MSGDAVTATLNVIGTGRVLYHRELVGRSLCYFLSITYAGRIFRWCFPSARDVWDTEVDGDSLHFQGMDYPQMSQAFDFDSDSPVDISVSFEDLTFPGDVDVPELLAQGHRLERCEAELSALPDHADALWSERQIVLVGEVREPVYGDPETHANTVGFTVDSPSWEDSSLFPPDAWVVTAEAWSTADDSAIGKVFPFVFGQPGMIRNPYGVRDPVQGSPGLPVAFDSYMFAGHLVAPATYDSAGIFVLQTFHNLTNGDTYTWNGATGPKLELVTSSSGFQYTGVDFTGEAGFTLGHEIWISSWSTSSGTTLAEEAAMGGYPNFTWDGPLITAGDVLYFMLLQSSLKIDRGRTAVAQALLQGFRVSGYIDERVTPYEWITDNLLPILPIAMSQGPKGIFPIVWRYDAGPNDAVGRFIEGPRWRRVSGVTRDDSTILNKYTLSYGLDGSDFLLKFGIDGALEDQTDTTETGATYVPNLYARRSYLEHGSIAVDETSDLVTTSDTAALVCAWKIRANALAKRFVSYEAPAEHAWLEPGDPILVTDPDLYFSEQVCLVRTKTWDVTSVVYELMILTDPARDQVPIEEAAPLPSPDALIAAAEALGTLVGFWLVNEGDETIIDGETIMADASAVSASAVVVKAELASAGTWTRDTTDAPPDFPASIKTTARGATNYMGFDAACASSQTVIMFCKVETPQGGSDLTTLGGGLGGVAAPEGNNDIFAFWDNTRIYQSGDGGGQGTGQLHGDYTGWVVLTFVRDSGGAVKANYSTVGGTWQDLGSEAGGVGYAAAWTGFNAFSSGVGRETGTGTVRHAGFMYFSNNVPESDIHQLLIDGGIITA